jgi:hypothetical protein
MDAQEWYHRQTVQLRNFEMQRDHPGVRLAREVSRASLGSRVGSNLRRFARWLVPARSKGPQTAERRTTPWAG